MNETLNRTPSQHEISSTAETEAAALPPATSRPISSDPNFANPYDFTFVLVYLANISFMLSYAALFRYSDFVKAYGGSDSNLGQIIAFGSAGSLIARIWLGSLIDRIGARWIWIAATLVWIVGLSWHLALSDSTGWTVFAARLVMQCGMAGFFGASLTFISLRVGVHRVAEVIGIVGTAGFVGMGFGPWFSDVAFAGFQSAALEQKQVLVTRMFLLSLAFAFATLVCVSLAAREPPKRRGTRAAPLLLVIRKYHPGVALILASVMGMGISFPVAFARPLAESRGLASISTFFIAYAISAFVLRFASRRLPEILGLLKMIVMGFVCLAASMPLYFLIHHDWQLIFPAVVAGAAHAFLFPSLIALCSQSFPDRFRGVATTLALAMFDLGTLLGAALIARLVVIQPAAAEAIATSNYGAVLVVLTSLFASIAILIQFFHRSIARQAGLPT